MTFYSIRESKIHLSRLVDKAQNGEEVIITRFGKPVARILSISNDIPTRVPGVDRGKIEISPDFDAPLPEVEQ